MCMHITILQSLTGVTLSKKERRIRLSEQVAVSNLSMHMMGTSFVGKVRDVGQIAEEGEAEMSAPPFFQLAGRGDLLFWGDKERTNGSNMGEPIRTRKEKLVGRVQHNARLGRVAQVKKRGGGNPII